MEVHAAGLAPPISPFDPADDSVTLYCCELIVGPESGVNDVGTTFRKYWCT